MYSCSNRLYDKESKLMPPNDLSKCKSASTSPANSPPRLADDITDWNPFDSSEPDFGEQFDKIKRGFKGSNDSTYDYSTTTRLY